MNLGEMLADVYSDMSYGATPAANVVARITANINKAHRAILREPGLLRLRDTVRPLTFDSEAGRYIYGLPSQLGRIKAITERDNDRELDDLSIPDLRATDPGFTSTGTPYAYVPLGYRQIQNVPVSTGLWAVSSSASDTTQVIRIEGVRAAGLASGDSATLTGTTRVQIGTITDYVDVQTFSTSAVGVGVISLYDAASNGNLLGQIPIGHTAGQYFVVQLYPTPEGVITYYVDGVLRIPTLDNNQDVPMLPDEFHDVLVAYARSREYEKTGDASRMMMADKEYGIGLTRLKDYLSQPSEVPIMGRPARRRYSRLGPWAPAWSGD